MVVVAGQGVLAGRSLKSLVNGFVLTKQTEGKSPRTVEFSSENLKRFLWYASRQGWSDDIRMVTQWHVREFLGYLANEKGRWGLEGNGLESSPRGKCRRPDRKSTRLNSSHGYISYAVFCLKKNKKTRHTMTAHIARVSMRRRT